MHNYMVYVCDPRLIRNSLLSLTLSIAQVGDATDNVQVVPKSNTHAHAHGKRKGTSVHENLNSSELFNLYTMLNDVKVDLLWGRNSEEQPEETAAAAAAAQAAAALAASTATLNIDATSTDGSIGKGSTSSTGGARANSTTSTATTTAAGKGHVRRPSTVSVASSNSTNTLSDSDSDISNENDSGIESEPARDVDKSSDLARQYRQHLLGLYRCLEQMTEAANYLTNRYQSDVGPV